jgi:hypothetical protein
METRRLKIVGTDIDLEIKKCGGCPLVERETQDGGCVEGCGVSSIDNYDAENSIPKKCKLPKWKVAT